ncbi:beta-phosphoglucomutase family hydrolase [Gordonia sp. HY002]|uniref:beta-phosphoglucomutase family hydrolase n=1 Tax=Gordonia zhenghanii TaxID=2911516 RepID=UPI001EF0C7A6|nr:beta-phosphoglucomutase family hydrolase [Gordonia zhenghanii]MCF8570310.1 beta-phosphoglucomutase family hydrolase [Gordonia zhenghanii]MCF8605926.1 beta-phosphoglucomutase family hydrolase [Gordonia zhenghanii]
MLGLPDDITVALFDLDGVLTTTAVLHKSAWKNAFDAFLTERGAESGPFTDHDYLAYVDGRPRLDGVRSFLDSRGIEVDDATVEAIAEAKNTEFLDVLDSDGVTAYPGSVRYLNAALEAGLRIAVVTSSKNGARVLDAADLSRFVEHRVDGNTIVDEHLAGKPAPDSYERGAELMGVAPAQAAVFEDAISGVAAGAAGAFGYIVGIDRVGGDQADSMRAAGASIVVTDLDDLLQS